MEKSRKPKIRFKGFTDDWEQRELGELGEIMTGVTPSTSKPEYYSEDGIPWVTPTDINALTISDTPRKLSEEGMRVGRVVPANTILCTCIASIGKNALLTVKGSFNQQINSLTPNAKNDAYFLLTESELWSDKMKRMAASGTMQIVNKSEFAALTTMVPSIDEQKKLGTCFSNLDNLITLHQRKLDKLVNVKKSMLEKMFPQQGSRIPEIRFCGFTDDWEQRKLVELLTKYTDEVNVPHNGYERLGIRSHAKGTFHSYVSEGHELQTGKMHKVAADKFIVNITFGWEHAVAVTDKNDAGKLVSHRFPQYSLSENLYSKFFKYIILDDKFKHHLWLSSPGGAGRNRVLKLDEMLEYKIKIPNVQEQQKIAEVLMDLDHLITLHQRKLEKLKNIKKSMLEKMFI